MTKSTIPQSVKQAAARGPVTLHKLGHADPAEDSVVLPYRARSPVHALLARLRKVFAQGAERNEP